MTPENDSAEQLLEDLENLHKFLGEAQTQENEVELPADELEFELSEHIPILADEVAIEEKQLATKPANGEHPLSDQQISVMIDSLVAEYLPAIEEKLRKQLLQALTLS